MSTVRMLGAAEVKELVRKVQSGDSVFMPVIVEHFRPLVLRVARTYAAFSYEDAVQEGYVALIHAVLTYDEDSGVPFAGYAMSKVRGDVRTAMRRQWTNARRTVLAGWNKGDSESRSFELYDVGCAVVVDPYAEIDLLLTLDGIPMSQRERIGLWGLVRGLTSPDLAERMGVGLETAKTWRKRALRKVRAALAGDDEF